ncbi:mu-type opioid receptor-like [Palaemon carinicauda]|uniref:mu-type opioid receptor-like n=1 Tax=Palaemon carinicauda TaxID=392227 RepID=UPI0035B5AE43
MASTTDETNSNHFNHDCSGAEQECVDEFSSRKHSSSSYENSQMLQMVLMNTLSTVGLLGSFCAISLLVRAARNDVFSRYIVCRAVAEILLLLTVPLDALTFFYNSWLFGDVMCKFRNSLAFYARFMSSANQVGMCVNAYIEECVLAPNVKLRSAVFKGINFVSWSVSLVIATAIFVQSETSPLFCISSLYMSSTWQSHYLRVLSYVMYSIVSVTVSWIFLILTVVTKKKEFSLTIPDTATGSLTMQKRSLQLSFAITIAFTILQMTYCVPYLLLDMVSDQDSIASLAYVALTTLSLPALNVVVDVILYAIFMRDAYKYVRKMSLSTDDQLKVPLKLAEGDTN